MTKPPPYTLKNIKKEPAPAYEEKIYQSVKELRIEGKRKIKEDNKIYEEKFYQKFKELIKENIVKNDIKNYIKKNPHSYLMDLDIYEKNFNKKVIKRYNKDKNNIYKLKYSKIETFFYCGKPRCCLKLNDKLKF